MQFRPAPHRGPFSLLVADDDPIIRDSVGLILRSRGYSITFTIDGQQAWDKATSEEFDLALVDLNMPGMNGFDFIGRCRASTALRNLPIIVITGLSDPDACDRAFDLGATSYVTKPLNWALFNHTVWYVLRNETREREMRDLKSQLGLDTRTPVPTV